MSSALTHLATPLMYLLALLVVGGLLFLLASFAFGRGERLAPMPPDVSPVVLPAARPVTGRDLRDVRMSVVPRGYRMSEVDWILDRMADQIDERDRELVRLRREVDRLDRADPVDRDPVDRDPVDRDPVAVDEPGAGPAAPGPAAADRVQAPARVSGEDRRDG